MPKTFYKWKNLFNERFNRTIQEEFIDLGNMTDDVISFNQRLTEWLIKYNFIRPHQTLNYETPWSFYERSAKVLPMWSSRTFGTIVDYCWWDEEKYNGCVPWIEAERMDRIDDENIE